MIRCTDMPRSARPAGRDRPVAAGAVTVFARLGVVVVHQQCCDDRWNPPGLKWPHVDGDLYRPDDLPPCEIKAASSLISAQTVPTCAGLQASRGGGHDALPSFE